MKGSIKVVRRKLGRFNALGLAYIEDRIIEVDERLKGKEELIVYIHEILHILNPEMTEEDVIHQSSVIGNILFREKYRKISE